MSDLPRRYLEHGVVLSGWSAYAFARVLGRHLPEFLASLDDRLCEPLEDGLAALDLAGREWAASARGGAAALDAALPVSSNHEQRETISSEEAGDMLGLSPRRVRELAAAGSLYGSRVAGRWTFDRGAVLAYREKESNDA